MRIGIDTRMCDPSVGGSGLARYVEQLVKELRNVDDKNRYVLFGKHLSGFQIQDSERFTEKKTNIPWYTIQEQLVLPRVIDHERLDLVHFPHWNVPVALKTPFVVTIHDLILLDQPRSARATTLHPLLYAIKYRGFRHVLSHAVLASKKIITVSHATKNDILHNFPTISPEKIIVIYEGITPLPPPSFPPTNYKLPPTSSLIPYPLPLPHSPYLLYVGNCYPHKNLNTLLTAFDILHKTSPEIHLLIAGRDDVFFTRLKKNASKYSCANFIHFDGNPSDARLAQLYAGATLYVFPSLIEGFGLPPLEAMSLNVPVATSDIEPLREILADAAVYFPPNDPGAIANTIGRLLSDPGARQILIQNGREQIKKYSWKKMTEQIVGVYYSCANS